MDALAEQCAREILDAVPLVMRFIRSHVRQHPVAGMALPQFRALSFLSRSADASVSEVAGHLGVALPAMSRLVNDLVQRGWVHRQPVAGNRRQMALRLTRPGRIQLETMRAGIRRQLAERLTSLPVADRRNIRGGMQILRRAFEAGPDRKADGGRKRS